MAYVERLQGWIGKRWREITGLVAYCLAYQISATLAHALLLGLVLLVVLAYGLAYVFEKIDRLQAADNRTAQTLADANLRVAGEEWIRLMKMKTGRPCRIIYRLPSGRVVEVSSPDFDAEGFNPIVKEINL